MIKYFFYCLLVFLLLGNISICQAGKKSQRNHSNKKHLVMIEDEEKESKSRSVDHPNEAQEFYLRQRVKEGESIPVEKYIEAHNYMNSMPIFSSRLGSSLSREAIESNENFKIGGISTWTSLGPGNIGGRTRVIIIDPASVSTMYVAAASGGVWKTIDSGTSWFPLTDFVSNLSINALVLDESSPIDARVLYAGTGEGYNNRDSIRGVGIFKSIDSGVTWTSLSSTTVPDFYYVNDIVLSPSNPSMIYASTRTGVWKSINAGESWVKVLAADGSGNSNGTMVDTSQDLGMLDLVIREDIETKADILFVSSGGNQASDGIYRSANSGRTWTRVLTAPNIGRSTIAVAPSAPEIVYALCARTVSTVSRLLNVYRSIDGGETWEPRIKGTFDRSNPSWLLLTNGYIANQDRCSGDNRVPYDLISQGFYDNVIAVSPTDPNVVFTGGIDLFRSEDGGSTFGPISYWWKNDASQFSHADHHALVFDLGWNGTTNQTIYDGNDGGVFKSTNSLAAVGSGDIGGICYFRPSIPSNVTWKNLNNGYAVTQFYHGAVYPGGSSFIGGTQDNGVVRGTAGSFNNWTSLLSGADGGYCLIDPTTLGNSTTLYFSDIYLSIRKSVNNGETALSAVSGIDKLDLFNFITPVAMDPKNPQILWTAGTRPWRTTNSATKWTAASAEPFNLIVSAIGIAPSDSSVVYMGTIGGDIFNTTNGLDSIPSWTKHSSGLPKGYYCSGITVDPNNFQIAYATFSSFGIGHVFKTTNSGLTWTNIDGAGDSRIPDIPVHCIAIHPTVDQVLYVGTDLGVFVSTDGGQSWNIENTGFASVSTQALVWEPTSQPGVFSNPPVLYAFTHGRGAYKTEVNIAPPKAPSDLEVKILSPNSVSLIWADHSSDEIGFSIERKNGSTGKYVEALTTPSDITTAKDKVEDGINYFYRVRAIGKGSGSSYSNEASITTSGVAAPSNLVAKATSRTETKLIWNDNSFNETGFHVERKEETGKYELLNSLGENIVSFVDNQIRDGVVYFYRVQAIGKDGILSAYSNEYSPVPKAPSALSGEAVSFTQINLTWKDNSVDETGFSIEKKIDINGDWGEISRISANSTKYTNSVVPGQSYFYRVRAINEVFSSIPSNEIRVNVDSIPSLPTTPEKLAAVIISSSEVELTWIDKSSNESGFLIERKVRNGEYFPLTTTAADVQKFKDTSLFAGTPYTYRIRAINGGGRSSFSNEVSIMTSGIAAPSGLIADPNFSSEVILTWIDNSLNETGFVIERKLDGFGDFSLISIVKTDEHSFKDENLKPRTKYIYRVKAFNAIEGSLYSNEISVLTKPDPPVILKLIPKKVSPGGTLTIKGRNFYDPVTTIDDIRLILISSMPDELKVIVPSSLRRGTTVHVDIIASGGLARASLKIK